MANLAPSVLHFFFLLPYLWQYYFNVNSLLIFLGSSTCVSLWEFVISLLKRSLQLIEAVKRLYKQLMEKEDEDGECRRKWVELSVHALLCLFIETLRHSNTGADNMTLSVHHMTMKRECTELIFRNLSSLTSCLDFLHSTYVLKECVHLHQKTLSTCTFLHREYNLVPLHNSLVKLYQSSVFIRTAQAWMRTVSKSGCLQANHLDATSRLISDHVLTLEDSLVSTVMRSGALLLLKYSAAVVNRPYEMPGEVGSSMYNVHHTIIATYTSCIIGIINCLVPRAPFPQSW